ncbi:MAG: PH domain-containing protein [Deltaproteobacteria bacterium]|nr:PH domain-containing protein [Deltaproteobacteria bacterium]
MDNEINNTESKLRSGLVRSQDLKSRFPISTRIILKQLFPWVMILALLVVFAVKLNSRDIFSDFNTILDLDIELEAFVAFVLIVLFVKAIYSILYRHRISYRIEEGHLKLSKGILIRDTGIYPLSRISDVYCKRSLLDALLGLHCLVICTATPLSVNFAQIPGLTSNVAEGLSEFLLSSVEDYQLRYNDISAKKGSKFV